MKKVTTHQMAKQLLELPDVELLIEGWIRMDGYTMTASMTSYDPKHTAIIWQKPKRKKKTKAQLP